MVQLMFSEVSRLVTIVRSVGVFGVLLLFVVVVIDCMFWICRFDRFMFVMVMW